MTSFMSTVKPVIANNKTRYVYFTQGNIKTTTTTSAVE